MESDPGVALTTSTEQRKMEQSPPSKGQPVYAPPKLEVYGTVAELTAGGSGQTNEVPFFDCRDNRNATNLSVFC